MEGHPTGRLIAGDETVLRRAYEQFESIPPDFEAAPERGAPDQPDRETTLREQVSVSGPGTFLGKAQRTLYFEPTALKGWWFDRTDLPNSMPIRVSVDNVWTTVRNIVLASGSPHNYMRMVEHIIALKVGMGLDNVMIRMDSGDPPLFERSSMDMVEAIEKAGLKTIDRPASFWTVSEPVTICRENGSFLTCLPAEKNDRGLHVDCAVDFKSAIGRQRIRFTVNNASFRQGALARTNTTFWVMFYCKTLGKIFADVRNLGYTTRNILVVGPGRYFNKPRIIHNGKSLEAVWHRATLDLLAAIALVDRGRFAGTVLSYKAGHALDVELMRELYRRALLVPA